jgi:formate dehydrogenase major subunit
MVIWTESPAAVNARKEILLQKLARHPMDCMNCGKLGDCKLQIYCEKYGLKEPLYTIPTSPLPIDDSNDFYFYDPNKCISCGKCARVCGQLIAKDAIKMAQYGAVAKVVPKTGANLAESDCVHCGNCVSFCPVGALMPKSTHPYRAWETKKVRTTCPYCGVGCQMDLVVKDDKVVDVQPAYGVTNEGLLCVKGKFAFDFVNHPKRLTEPLVRDKTGALKPATWDQALDLIANKIKEIKAADGPDAIMGLASARVTNEDNYVFSKFMRAVVGTNNVDHCARL